jgi:hypothetical protein
MTGDAASQARGPIPIHDAILDDATVDQLFFDVAHTAQLIAVMEKPGRGQAPATSEALWSAHRALRARSVSAVQLRYRFAGEEWWDTVLWTDAGIRLVRISHTRAVAQP